MNLGVTEAFIGDLRISGRGVPLSGVEEVAGLSITSLKWTKTPRTNRRQRPRAHGSVDLTRYYEGRLYELAGVLKGVTEAEAQALLDSFESHLALMDDSVEFKFLMAGRDDSETAQVKVDGDLEYAFDYREAGVIRWALTLFSPDPRRYGDTQRSGSYSPSSSGDPGGLDLPVVFPIVWAGGGATYLTVENAGNFPTPPVFTITGPVTNPIIDNDTTGESLTTQDFALADDDVAEIDVGARTLTVGGVERPDLIDPTATDWPELVAGVNNLRLRGSDMVGTTSLAVSFYDARI